MIMNRMSSIYITFPRNYFTQVQDLNQLIVYFDHLYKWRTSKQCTTTGLSSYQGNLAV